MRVTGTFATLVLASIFATAAFADWEFYEETTVAGKISGTVKKGRVIKMQSDSIYQVTGITIHSAAKSEILRANPGLP